MLQETGCDPDLHLHVECNGVKTAVSREDNPKTFTLNLCQDPIPSHRINALISASLLHVYLGAVCLCGGRLVAGGIIFLRSHCVFFFFL